jgi:hypothetical protein
MCYTTFAVYFTSSLLLILGLAFTAGRPVPKPEQTTNLAES